MTARPPVDLSRTWAGPTRAQGDRAQRENGTDLFSCAQGTDEGHCLLIHSILKRTPSTVPAQSNQGRDTKEGQSTIEHPVHQLNAQMNNVVPKGGVEPPRGCPQRILSLYRSGKWWTRPRPNGNDFRAVRVPRATSRHRREPLKPESLATEAPQWSITTVNAEFGIEKQRPLQCDA